MKIARFLECTSYKKIVFIDGGTIMGGKLATQSSHTNLEWKYDYLQYKTKHI